MSFEIQVAVLIGPSAALRHRFMGFRRSINAGKLCAGGHVMILRRVTHHMKAQNWSAIAIEFVLVVLGVFLGIVAANWNEERLEKRETARMLMQLAPELDLQLRFFETAKRYYATTRHYADVALAAWRGDPRISDAQFVISAYQASQVYGILINADNWSMKFGGDELRNIEDDEVRRNMELVLTQDYAPVRFEAVATDYRRHVRSLIPIAVQERIRAECGDRSIREDFLTELPATCSARIPADTARDTAAALRAEPELAKELTWHLAAVVAYLRYGEQIERRIRALRQQLKVQQS